MVKKRIRFCLILFLVLGLTGIAFAQATKQKVAAPKEKAEKLVSRTATMKEVVGEIIWMNDKYIAVLYHRDPETGDEYEMLFPWNKKTIGLEHLRSVSEIEKGDIIRVKYEEDHALYDTKREEVRRRPKVIGFVRKGAPKPKPAQPQDSGILKSE